MEAERPAQREGIPAGRCVCELGCFGAECVWGYGSFFSGDEPSRAAARYIAWTMESRDLRTCIRLRGSSCESGCWGKTRPVWLCWSGRTIWFDLVDALRRVG